MQKKTFTYEEAVALLPEVQRRTRAAVDKLETLLAEDQSETGDPETTASYQEIVSAWAESIVELGIEVKGLWLIDFDTGSGYYCWRYPEPALQYFHGYDEGFDGRIQLN